MADIELARNYTVTDVGGGKRRLLSTIHDVRYLSAGFWSDVVERFASDGLDGFAWKADAMRHALRLAEDGGRRWFPRRDVPGEYLTVGRPEPYIGGQYVTQLLAIPSLDGGTVRWDRLLWGMGLTVNWHRVKFELYVKSKLSPHRFRFPLSATGLRWDGWQLFSGETSVGCLGGISAWDANGADVPVTATLADGYLEVVALPPAGAAYPITIDPTLTAQPDGTDGIDTTILQADADASYATTTTLRHSAVDSTHRGSSLIRFNTSSVPAGATIDSGTFTLWCAVQAASRSGELRVYRILSANSAWNESSTWNYKTPTSARWAGDSGSDGGADAGCDVSGTDYSATQMGSFSAGENEAVGTQHDVALNTTELASMVSANCGMITRKIASTGYWDAASSDHATTGYRPKLVMEYTEAAGGQPFALRGEGTIPGRRLWSPGRIW